MLDLILCGVNLSCYVKEIKGPKYPPEVAEICVYYEQNKIQLPDYCRMVIEPVRKRSEF